MSKEGNKFCIVRTSTGAYVHLETDWSNQSIEKMFGVELVDFYASKEDAVRECNRLNAQGTKIITHE